MSNHLFPPTLPEWHGFVVGFGGGFVFGATPTKKRGIVIAVLMVGFVVLSVFGGHISQAVKEAAYTVAGFVIGALVGRYWRRKGKPMKP